MSKVIFRDSVGVELCLSWLPAAGNEIPEGALDAGDECYVIRALHQGEWVPGKLVSSGHCAYISYGGSEIPVEHYQVLVRSDTAESGHGYSWAHVTDGHFPRRALIAGSDAGRPLLVARGKYNGETCTGKTSYGQTWAYIPYNTEKRLDNFEVLRFTVHHFRNN